MALSKEQQAFFQYAINGIRSMADCALMEVREKSTGRVLPMIVGIGPRDPVTGIVDFHPIAVMIDPLTAVDDYDPPNLDTGVGFEGD